MKSEAEIQKEIIGIARVHGALVFRMNAGRGKMNQRLAPAGTPDLLMVMPRGDVIWVEVKQRTGSVRTEQANMHKELSNRKQTVIVASSVDDVLEYL